MSMPGRLSKLTGWVRRVDVSALGREIGVPARTLLQRRVDDWLEALRDETSSSLAGAKLDLFDALRSQMLVQGSSALATACVAEALRTRHAGQFLLLHRDLGDVSLRRLLNRPGEPTRSIGFPHDRFGSCRDSAHVLTHELRRLWRSATPQPSDIRLPAGSVLALPRGPDHFADLLPVARRLRDDHGIHTGIVATTGALSLRARESGHETLPCEVPRPNARQLAELLRAGLSAIRRAETLAERGHPGFARGELIALSRAAQGVLLRNLFEAWRVAEFIGPLLSRVRPRALLVGNPYTFEGRIGAIVARAAGTPSVAIQHGAIFPNDPRWNRCPVDVFCVWGEASRTTLIESGVAESSVRVTGSPRLDGALRTWKTRAFESNQQACILVATSGPGDLVSQAQHEQFIETLFECAAGSPSRFVVKLHPKDREWIYKQARQRWPRARVELSRGDTTRPGLDIYDFLQNARALVTISSTTALNAMVVGVPVLVFAPSGMGNALSKIPYLNPPLVERVSDTTTLHQGLDRAWRGECDESRAHAARAHAQDHFAHRGSAAEQVAKVIAGLGGRPAALATSAGEPRIQS